LVTIVEDYGLSPLIPDEHEIAVAQASSRLLAPFVRQADDIQVQVLGEGDEPVVTLPAATFQLLLRILAETAEGNAVTVMPHHAELTTQQAADLLGVSRPHLVKLLEEGAMPFHKVGTHRRVQLKDVLLYRQGVDAQRRAALDELAALSQELNLDEPLKK
jgi:excisionase family DNA binding protein